MLDQKLESEEEECELQSRDKRNADSQKNPHFSIIFNKIVFFKGFPDFHMLYFIIGLSPFTFLKEMIHDIYKLENG